MNNKKFSEYFKSIKDKLGIRKTSFTKIFQYLDNIKGPINIVETGCLRIKDNFKGDGQSTLLFDKYTQFRGEKSKVYTGDSVKYLIELLPKLKKEEQKISLFYLDSFDVDWQSSDRSAAHHLKEITAIINYISEETLIVIDDAPILAPMKIENKKMSLITEHPAPKPFIGGKGYLVNEFAFANNATLYFSNYQTAWFNFKKKL